MATLPALVGKAYNNPNSGSNATTLRVQPDSTIASGYWMIATVTTLNNTTSVTPPSGWTQLQALTVSGTLATAIYAKRYNAGEASYLFTFPLNANSSTVLLVWGSGGDVVSNWIIGATKLRANITPATSFNNVAPSITTTTANSLSIAISTERTTASETDASSVSGATEWYFAPQNGTSPIQTTLIAYINQASAGATGDVTVVYPNTQSANGQAIQIGIPPAPTTAPIAGFTTPASSGAAPVTTTFTDTSSYSPTSWSWNFGDGATSTTQNPSHTFTSIGTYTVTLTATNAGGSSTFSNTITVTSPRAVPVIETWPGSATNWSSQWAVKSGAAYTSSNFGYLSANSATTSAYGRADMISAGPYGDVDAAVTVAGLNGGIAQSMWFGINADPNLDTGYGVSPNEIYFQIAFTASASNSSVSLWQGSTQIGSSITKTISGNQTYRIRIRRMNGTINAHMWDVGGAEPVTWDFTVATSALPNYASDPSPSGVVSVGTLNGGSVQSTFLFSSLEVWPSQAAETWTGGNNAAWPAQWSSVINGGSATIQSNAGQLVTPAGSSAVVGDRVLLSSMAASATFDVYASVVMATASVNQGAIITIADDGNTSYASGGPYNGYSLNVSYNATAASSSLALGVTNNGSVSTLGSAATLTLTGTTTYFLRLQLTSDNVLQARIWASTVSEPTTWNVTSTISGTPLSGRVSLGAYTGSDGASRTATFDNLRVNSSLVSAALPYTETWTGSDNATWPATWQIGGTGSAYIKSNAGTMVTANTSVGNFSRADLSGVGFMSDTDVVVSMSMASATASQSMAIFLNSDGSRLSGSPYTTNNGYILRIQWTGSNTAAVSMFSFVNAVYTSIDTSGSVSWTATNTDKVRFQRNGTTLRWRIWDAAAAEPSTWNVSATVATPVLTGFPVLSFTNDNDTSSLTATVDNMIVSVPMLIPNASFTASPLSGSAPLTVNFTDTSTNTPTNWVWNFGDGTGNNTSQNPSHTFTAPGTYTVTLTALNSGGSTSTTKTITANGGTYTPLPYFDTWTGTNGAAWASTWTLDTIGTHGSASIQSNTGQLTTASGNGGTARIDLTAMPAIGDTEVLVQFTALSSGVEQYIAIGVNADPSSTLSNGSSTNELVLLLSFNATASSSSIGFYQGTTNISGSNTKSLSGGTKYNVRYRRYSGILYARIWLTTVAEPTSWDMTFTLSGISVPSPTGVVSLSASCGADGVARSIQFDNIEVWNAIAMETWTGSNGASWPSQWTADIPSNLTIQGGAGQIISPTGSYNAARGMLANASMIMGPAFEIYVTVTGSASGVQQFAMVGTGQLSDYASQYYLTGFYVEIGYAATPANSTLTLYYLGTSVTSTTVTLTGTTSYRVRVAFYNNFFGAKVWPLTSVEPSTWSVSYTTFPATPMTYYAALIADTGSAGGARTFTYDDLLVNGTPPSATTLPYTQNFDTSTSTTLPRELVPLGNNGTTTISSGRLQIVAPSDGSYNFYGMALSQATFAGNQRVVLDIIFGNTTAEQYNYIELRSSQALTSSNYSSAGYYFSYGYNFAQIGVHHGNETSFYYVSNWSAFDLTQPIHIDFSVTGTPGALLRLYAWQGTLKPAIPSILYVDVPSSVDVVTGGLMFYQAVGSTSAPMLIDNVSYTAPVGAVLPYTETWTGSNNAAWPTVWSTTNSAGSGGTALIQSNAGVLTAGSTSTSWEKALMTGVHLQTSDLDLLTSFTIGSQVSSAFNIGFNCTNDQYSSNPGEMPQNGYTVNFTVSATASASSFDMWKMSTGTQTQLYTTTTTTLTAGSTYNIRFQRVGTALRFRYWLAGNSEPTTWTATATDSGTMLGGGHVQLTAGNSSSQTITYDNLTIKVPVSVPYTQSFTAISSTNNLWPAEWTFRGNNASPGAAFAAISSSAGVMNPGAGGAVGGGNGVRAALESLALGDTDAVVTVTMSTGQYVDLSINGSGTGSGLYGFYNGPVGYTFELDSIHSTVYLYQITADGTNNVTQLGTASFTIATGTAYRVRLQRIGTRLRAKVWQLSNSEPTAWNITSVVQSPMSGFPSLGIQNDSTGYSPATFDDFSVSSPVGGEIKVYTGSAFTAKPVKVWNGTAWTVKPLKVWDGSQWDETIY